MGIFRQFVYSKQGTELEFWQGLLDIITGLDENIRIQDHTGELTTVAAQFADRTSSSRAEFYCNFGNGIIFRMERAYSNNMRNDQVFYYDNTGSRVGAWWNGNFNVDTVATRSVFVAYIKSENFVWFGLAAYNSNLSGVYRAASRLTVDGNVYAKSIQSNNPMSGTFVGENSSAEFMPFFTYAEPSGTISYINKAIFVNGGVRQFETSNIMTCTNVSTFSTLSFNGRNYLAIGTNALLELTDEEDIVTEE